MAPLSGGDLQGGDGGPRHVLSSIHNEGGENQLQSFRHMWNGAMTYRSTQHVGFQAMEKKAWFRSRPALHGPFQVFINM